MIKENLDNPALQENLDNRELPDRRGPLDRLARKVTPANKAHKERWDRLARKVLPEVAQLALKDLPARKVIPAARLIPTSSE